MPIDAFLYIEGIDGESTDEKHKGWFELMYFKSAVSQQINRRTSSVGDAIGRASFNDLIITKEVDKSSPKLCLFCSAGTHINRVILDLCRAGGDKVTFMVYEFTNCIISEINTGANKGFFPAETVKFNFGKIQWRYVLQNRAGGGPAGNIVCGWDLQRNSKI